MLQILPKIIVDVSFAQFQNSTVCPPPIKTATKALDKGWCPPQELDEGPQSRPYLLLALIKQICYPYASFKITLNLTVKIFQLHEHLLADPGEARGCSTNTYVTHWFINWLSNPLVKISLRCRQAQTVKNGAFSHKKNYIEILNLEGHLNRCIGSKVTVIFLNKWILPTG